MEPILIERQSFLDLRSKVPAAAMAGKFEFQEIRSDN